jgi:FtsZ-binding cell division protein ZapB
MELNAEQIKKALEEMNMVGVNPTAIRKALSLITSQEQRIKELTEENERLHASCTELERKCVSLNESYTNLERKCKKWQERFQKMLDRISEHATNGHPRKVRLDVVEKIAKEMLEEG